MNPEDVLRELKDPDRWVNIRVPRSRAAERRRVAPARAVQLVAAFTVAVLAIAGILIGLETARHSAPPAATTIPSDVPTTVPTSVTGFAVVPGVRHEYSVSVQPARCALPQLQTASKQDGGGAAGAITQDIALRNTGGDCLLGADAVRVGGAVASAVSEQGSRGLVLPAQATAFLRVTTASACEPGGTTNTIAPTAPMSPIVLRIGDAARTMTARFPVSRCTQPHVDEELSTSAASGFTPAIPAPRATVDQPSTTPAGPPQYDVDLENPGTTAIATCPRATEVLEDGNGGIVTRALTLRCPAGSTLQPGVPVHLTVSTTIPAAGTWTISWFLGGSYTGAIATSTCSPDQLRVSEPDEPGGATGNWVQQVTIENRGGVCDLPVAAFSISGRPARSGPTPGEEGFLLPAASTTQVTVSAPTSCSDGSVNIRDTRSHGPDDEPIALELGGKELEGLDRPFPQLHCTGPRVERSP